MSAVPPGAKPTRTWMGCLGTHSAHAGDAARSNGSGAASRLRRNIIGSLQNTRFQYHAAPIACRMRAVLSHAIPGGVPRFQFAHVLPRLCYDCPSTSLASWPATAPLPLARMGNSPVGNGIMSTAPVSPPRPPVANNLAMLLSGLAEHRSEDTAFIHGEERLSFGQLNERALRAAQGLAELGVGPGDRVALWLPNVPAYPILYFACALLGAIAVAVNTRYRAVEVADIVGRSGAKVLACAPAFRRIDFLSILADIDPAALHGLAALVVVGAEPATRPPAIEKLQRVPLDRLLARPPLAASQARPDAPCNI